MFLRRTLLKRHSVLPGFDLALGFTLLYLGFIVLIPLAAAFLKTFTMSWPAFWDTVTAPRVMASYRLTFGASFGAEAEHHDRYPAGLDVADHLALQHLHTPG